MIPGPERALAGTETGVAMNVYHDCSNSGHLLSTYCAPGVLLMILSFVFVEGLLWAWPGLFPTQETQQ